MMVMLRPQTPDALRAAASIFSPVRELYVLPAIFVMFKDFVILSRGLVVIPMLPMEAFAMMVTLRQRGPTAAMGNVSIFGFVKE